MRYSIEPADWDKKGVLRLHEFEILGQANLSSDQEAVAVGAFDHAIAGWNGAMMACFEPRLDVLALVARAKSVPGRFRGLVLLQGGGEVAC